MTEGLLAKKCRKCGEWKPGTAEFFTRSTRYADGLLIYCKCCSRAAVRRYQDKYFSDEASALRLAERPDHKKCPVCAEVKPATAFYSSRRRSDALSYRCKECRAVEERDRVRGEKWKADSRKRKKIHAIKAATAIEVCKRLGIDIDNIAKEKYYAEFGSGA